MLTLVGHNILCRCFHLYNNFFINENAKCPILRFSFYISFAALRKQTKTKGEPTYELVYANLVNC